MSRHSSTDAAAPTRDRRRSRAQVLELLRGADEPVSVADIAAATGLHQNTARFHLDGLVESGLARRESAGRGRPGRPRTVYLPAPTEQQRDTRSWRLLAEMLTSLVTEAMPAPVEKATQAGAAWGRYLVERPAPSDRVDSADALRRLHTVLADAGFAPETEPETDPGKPVVSLRHCPFREIAEQHSDVVCALHLGLMQGALAETRAPLTTEKLEPFAEPSRCLAYLTTTLTTTSA